MGHFEIHPQPVFTALISKRRWSLANSSGSKVSLRSRGMSRTTFPLSVITVFSLRPLRRLVFDSGIGAGDLESYGLSLGYEVQF